MSHNNVETIHTRSVRRATRALRDYTDDQETNIIDILTDLRHYCSEYEINFARTVEYSKVHHECELIGEA